MFLPGFPMKERTGGRPIEHPQHRSFHEQATQSKVKLNSDTLINQPRIQD